MQSTTVFDEETCYQCRGDFPSLSRTIGAHPVAFLDGPGGTQVPKPVIDAIVDCYRNRNVNTHGNFQPSAKLDTRMLEARCAVADLLGAAGPEHRIERFVQLSAEGNVLVANCSTAAQYFHLLRMQALGSHPQPLVIFTPKSLLRLKAAYGTAGALTDGAFEPVIDDPRFAKNGASASTELPQSKRGDDDATGDESRERVERVLLCSGKIYFDLVGHPGYAKTKKTAIVRVELLSPLPVGDIIAALTAYPNLKRVVWVQEEPQNMGARAHVRRRIVKRLPYGIADVEYVGRSYRASPSEGYGGAHNVEQERIVSEALWER